jgi:hypothetical protein
MIVCIFEHLGDGRLMAHPPWARRRALLRAHAVRRRERRARRALQVRLGRDGGVSPWALKSFGYQSAYILLVIICTKYTGWRQNDGNVHA